MQKRLLKVAIATALTVAFAAPAFANPFTDVPAKHWAYDAVNKLAQAGIVDGYGDGSFRGDKTITRYEMAQIVAKAMNKNLNSDQKAIVDKLAKEYAVELNNLGVKVEGLQNQVDNMVKFSGDARVRYYNSDNQDNSKDKDSTEYRVRLGATAKVNDTSSLYARITSGSVSTGAENASASIDNAYLSTKLLGTATKIGRQDYDLGQGMLAGAGSVAIMNGVSVRAGDFMAIGGRESNGTSMVNTYGAQYNFALATVPFSVSYLNQDSKNYYAAGTSFNLLPGFKVSGEYAKNDSDNAKAYQIKATLGKTGLSAAYKNVERSAVPFESALNLKSTGSILSDFRSVAEANGRAKGMEYEYNADLAKNTSLNVLYQDITDATKNIRATVNVKF